MRKGLKKRTNTKGSAGINRSMGEKYLKKNGQKEEVETRGSGLQIEFLERGDGGFVPYGGTITVEQKITLVDGTVLSDTEEDERPETFLLKDVIKGYHEGLLMMNVGDRCRLTIPHELAWQKRGTNAVPPSSVIIIDCKVISVE